MIKNLPISGIIDLMIDTLKIFDELKETMDSSAAKKIAEVIGSLYEELRNTVTKEEFNELREIVAELAEAQKRTEQRVAELAEAQKRTEQRVEELAEAQKRTEGRLTRLEETVAELAEAQKRTEGRLTRLEETVAELAEAQKRTEQRMEELAEAQKRTEQELAELAKAHRETRKMVGGLSDAVGYGLEDRAIKSLPGILKTRYGIEVIAPLVRKFVSYDGRRDELNIFGEGRKGKRRLTLLGEAKARLSRKHVDSFLKLVHRLERHGIVSEDRFLLMVTYSVEPDVEGYARERGVEVIWSYEV